VSDPKHRRLLLLVPIALVVVAVFVIPVAILLRGHFRRQAVVSSHQADIEAIRQRGGTVVFGSSGERGLPTDVKSVDLSDAIVDAELIQTLSRFTEIERLTLDGAKLQPEDYALLSKLSQLRSLSLSRTNVTDTHASRLPLGLTSLSLKGTPVTDKSMSRLAAISGLVSLDITDTEITPDGLRLLEPLRSLKTLWIDDCCITAESVESLRLMQPEIVNVAVLEGMGRRTHEFLSVCQRPKIRGHHRDGYVLWEADSAWNDTLAGVVEAVVAEIGLDSHQAAQLLEVLGKEEPPMGGWKPILLGPLPAVSFYSLTSSRPDRGIEIASAEEFIRDLQKDQFDVDHWALRRFAREKFTAIDVPKLLAAIRAPQSSEGTWLFRYGPVLLVRHGIDDPEVIAELDRMLAHKDSFVRCATIFSFGYGGARRLFTHASRDDRVEIPLFSRDEWTASKEADAFALPRLLRICKDQGEFESLRNDARLVLAEIAHCRPEYASEVMPVLVDLLDEEGSWHVLSSKRHISRVDIARLAEVAPDAAIAVVPTLREMLKQLDERLVGAPAPSPEVLGAPPQRLRGQRISVLEALSATAGHSPALAHEIALEYLSRMREDQPIGPFAPLLSPGTPEANRKVVMELLGNTDVAKGELASLAKRIRDWTTTKEPIDEERAPPPLLPCGRFLTFHGRFLALLDRSYVRPPRATPTEIAGTAL
jgi:hypothetical protein